MMITTFLVIGFALHSSRYLSLILCKQLTDHTEYRITVMNGDIEKQLCKNNRLKESNGVIELVLSGNEFQDHVKLKIASALSEVIGKPLKQIKQ